MIPYDIDPTLHATVPGPELLGDGFAPPADPHHEPSGGHACEPVDPPLELGDKSPF